MNRDNVTGNITPGHVRAFQAITSRLYDNITLWSCRVNGEPGVAIVMVDQAGPGQIAIMPLFVALTESMDIVFADEGEGEAEDGGGPKHPAADFAANKEAVTGVSPR